jgi:opacity protein-like surface antigen
VLKKILLLSLLAAPAAFGQVASSARGGDSTLWAGGEFSYFNPDYGSQSLAGIGAFVDYNLTPKLGVEGEMRWLRWHNSNDGDENQSNYLGGVKYRLLHHQRFSVNAKFLLGGVWIDYPYVTDSSGGKERIGTGSYFAYVPGGDVEYRVSSHWAARAGYEYQILPSAPGFAGESSNGLTPHGFSIGVAYRLLGVR